MVANIFPYEMNDSEQALFKKNPKFAQAAIDEAYFSTKIELLIFTHWPTYNDNSDAFRHCLWSALIAHKTTSDWAKLWTNAHEKVEVGIDEDDTSVGHRMDLFNNNVGISISKNNPNKNLSFIINECVNSLKNGKLRRIQNNKNLTATSAPDDFLFDVMDVIVQDLTVFFEFLCDYFSKFITKLDKEQRSVLHYSAQKNYTAGINIILSRNLVDINMLDGFNLTPLAWAISNDHIEAIKLLISKGADVNLRIGNDGSTPIMFSVKNCRKKTILYLASLSNLNLKKNNGYTAYDIALNENRLDLIDFLRPT